jgi:SAM-dependent methyltransferase
LSFIIDGVRSSQPKVLKEKFLSDWLNRLIYTITLVTASRPAFVETFIEGEKCMDKVISYYNRFDEWGRLDREPIEFLVNSHYIMKYLPKHGHLLDNGAGPGKYSFEFAKQGFDITLTDLTPRLVEVAYEKASEFELVDRFKGFHVADARNLDIFTNQQFDASLMLGPCIIYKTNRNGVLLSKNFIELRRVVVSYLLHL